MPTKPKAPKKAKRVNWKAYARHCEAVIDIQIDVERARTEHVNRLIRERTAWEEAAARHCRNEEFYRNLVAKIGKPFGAAAKTSDDGSVQQDVLALKVPELVEALRHNYQDWRQRAEAAECHSAELLREVEELKKCNKASEVERKHWLQRYQDLARETCPIHRPHFWRLRAFLRSFRGKGLSAGE